MTTANGNLLRLALGAIWSLTLTAGGLWGANLQGQVQEIRAAKTKSDLRLAALDAHQKTRDQELERRLSRIETKLDKILDGAAAGK